MGADDTGCVQGGHFDNIRSAGICVMLAGTRKGGLQKAPVTQPGCAAVERQEPVVDRENVALFDPAWFLTLLRRHGSLCQGVKGVAIAAHDFFRLRHFLLERRIVRGEPVIAVPRLDKKKSLPVAGLQAVDHFFRQNDAQRVAKFTNLEFNHGAPLCYYNCNNISGDGQDKIKTGSESKPPKSAKWDRSRPRAKEHRGGRSFDR